MHSALDWLMLAIVVAIIFVLVRPGSGAPALLAAFFGLMTSIVSVATDLATPGTSSSTGGPAGVSSSAPFK